MALFPLVNSCHVHIGFLIPDIGDLRDGSSTLVGMTFPILRRHWMHNPVMVKQQCGCTCPTNYALSSKDSSKSECSGT